RLIKKYLENDEFIVEDADDGDEVLERATEQDYDVIILDIMMRGMKDIEVCEEIYKVKATPIILLTAHGEESNRILCFELGADDYIEKPFSPRELVLRVKAILRRVTSATYHEVDTSAKNLLVFPHLAIDLDAYRVTADNIEVNLTPKEYELLVFLAESPDKV